MKSEPEVAVSCMVWGVSMRGSLQKGVCVAMNLQEEMTVAIATTES